MLSTAALPKPHTVVFGARRTPGPQLAPTGSDASIASHTESAAACSYCLGQPTCRFQLAVNSACDCVLNVTPAAGFVAGGCWLDSRLYAGASSTSFATFAGLRDA